MKESDPILEMYIFESTQMIEGTEAVILDCEDASSFSPDSINKIFRNMHTLKGSSAMMQYLHIADTAHAVEDLFHILREKQPAGLDFNSLSDLVLQSVDYLKDEVRKISQNEPPGGTAIALVNQIQQFIVSLQSNEASSHSLFVYHAIIHFYNDCEMENIRAYQLVNRLNEVAERYFYDPEELIENNDIVRNIRDRGFHIVLETPLNYEQTHEFLMKTSFLQNLELQMLDAWPGEQLRDGAPAKDAAFLANELESERLNTHDPATAEKLNPIQALQSELAAIRSAAHSPMISVHVQKLDRLMDLVGELVIAEAMVTSSNDLHSGNGDSPLYKAASQLRKITGELQDTVMSIRMVPLTATFHKMRRVTRDMCRKLDKEIEIVIIGEETEVDKSVIDQISDPLMHLVRNAIDHGIESAEVREAAGKPLYGTVTLEAKNIGSDVLLIVKDDGKGLNRAKIIERAQQNGLLGAQHGELSDRDAYNLIFQPGLSTQDQITEFSGRGVGMDVVARNVEQVGGMIYIDSVPGEGTTVTMKIPLTLAIIDGMNVRVGQSHYTLPTTSIKESFRPLHNDLLTDPDGNRMVMVRGECYSILDLHERFHDRREQTDFTQGVLIMAEQNGKSLCLFVDELLGQQQVVIKPLPAYLRKLKRSSGLSGCTLLGDGSISLILNMAELVGISHTAGS